MLTVVAYRECRMQVASGDWGDRWSLVARSEISDLTILEYGVANFCCSYRTLYCLVSALD